LVSGALRKAWILGLATLLLMAGCADLVVKASFDSYVEAEDIGYVARGWIPEFVPETAGQIDEAHDLDTNQYCARVALVDSNLGALHAELADEGFRSYDGELPPPPRLALFKGCPFSMADIPADRQAFRTTLGSLNVVLDEPTRLLFYWSTSP